MRGQALFSRHKTIFLFLFLATFFTAAVQGQGEEILVLPTQRETYSSELFWLKDTVLTGKLGLSIWGSGERGSTIVLNSGSRSKALVVGEFPSDVFLQGSSLWVKGSVVSELLGPLKLKGQGSTGLLQVGQEEVALVVGYLSSPTESAVKSTESVGQDIQPMLICERKWTVFQWKWPHWEIKDRRILGPYVAFEEMRESFKSCLGIEAKISQSKDSLVIGQETVSLTGKPLTADSLVRKGDTIYIPLNKLEQLPILRWASARGLVFEERGNQLEVRFLSKEDIHPLADLLSQEKAVAMGTSASRIGWEVRSLCGALGLNCRIQGLKVWLGDQEIPREKVGVDEKGRLFIGLEFLSKATGIGTALSPGPEYRPKGKVPTVKEVEDRRAAFVSAVTAVVLRIDGQIWIRAEPFGGRLAGSFVKLGEKSIPLWKPTSKGGPFAVVFDPAVRSVEEARSTGEFNTAIFLPLKVLESLLPNKVKVEGSTLIHLHDPYPGGQLRVTFSQAKIYNTSIANLQKIYVAYQEEKRKREAALREEIRREEQIRTAIFKLVEPLDNSRVIRLSGGVYAALGQKDLFSLTIHLIKANDPTPRSWLGSSCMTIIQFPLPHHIMEIHGSYLPLVSSMHADLGILMQTPWGAQKFILVYYTPGTECKSLILSSR